MILGAVGKARRQQCDARLSRSWENFQVFSLTSSTIPASARPLLLNIFDPVITVIRIIFSVIRVIFQVFLLVPVIRVIS